MLLCIKGRDGWSRKLLRGGLIEATTTAMMTTIALTRSGLERAARSRSVVSLGRRILIEECRDDGGVCGMGLLSIKSKNASAKLREVRKGGVLSQFRSEHEIIGSNAMKGCKDQILIWNRFVDRGQGVCNGFSMTEIFVYGLGAFLKVEVLEFETGSTGCRSLGKMTS